MDVFYSKQKHFIKRTLQELEAEYLATFKKTVAQHEVLYNNFNIIV